MTKNDAKKLSVTDRRTDRPTDRRTDRAGCRVACNRLKNGKFIITTSFKKPYEISDFAHKNPLFSMIC